MPQPPALQDPALLVEDRHVVAGAGPIPPDELHAGLLWEPVVDSQVSRPAAGVSLFGPRSGMSLTPVTGPRRVRGGRTKTGRHAARQRGRPLTLTEKPRPDPRAATGIVPQ